MSGKPLAGAMLVSKHEKLVTSLLRPCPNGDRYGDVRINKAAGSCALACKHSGLTFAQLAKRLNLNSRDVKRLVNANVKGFFVRHGVRDLYWPAVPNKATLALESDALYQSIISGTTRQLTQEYRRDAAEWIKWMAQFVPDEAYEQRRAGLDDIGHLM